MIILPRHHRGSGLPPIVQIRNLLNEAIQPCRDRNFLAQGTWCCFNRRSLTVEVCGGVRWGQPDLPEESRWRSTQYLILNFKPRVLSSVLNASAAKSIDRSLPAKATLVDDSCISALCHKRTPKHQGWAVLCVDGNSPVERVQAARQPPMRWFTGEASRVVRAAAMAAAVWA